MFIFHQQQRLVFRVTGRVLALGLVACALAIPTYWVHASGLAELEQTERPVADAKKARTLKLISYLIGKSHYRKQPLDDAFSGKVFDAWIENLDPGRDVFLRSDIEKFRQTRDQFDDFIRVGALNPIYNMFDLLRQRVEERVAFSLLRLEQPFNFALNETYRYDRDEAAWAKTTQELDDLWRKRIKNDIISQRLSDKDKSDAEIRETLRKRYTHMARRIRQYNSEDVFQLFVNSYANAIEPHTSYFSPRASENFNIQMRLSLEGIGAVLQTEHEYTKINRIIPGGPADLSGELKADDRIIGVAQGEEEIVDVVGWRLDDVVDLIRGPKSSLVRLQVISGADGHDSKTRVISLRRDKIKLEEQAAKKRLVTLDTPQGVAKIGVIELPSFYSDLEASRSNSSDYRSTTRDVRKLIGEFKREGIDGLVVDLRENGGGSLVEAIALTGLFIESGPVVQVRDSGGNVHVDHDPDPRIAYDGPLAVMVDRYSASASEIFAGAIQDYQRGIIIGETTFGKGTVQHLLDLGRYVRNEGDLGRLKVTVAQFFRVSGDSNQHRGVVPDLTWRDSTVDEKTGDRAHENAIPWMRINAAGYTQFGGELSEVLRAKLKKSHLKRTKNDPDFKYFKAIRKLYNAQRKEKFVSLNQATREKQRAKRNAKRLKIENARRVALGETPFASVTEMEEYEDQEKDDDDEKIDAYLRESSHILQDYSRALGALGLAQ